MSDAVCWLAYEDDDRLVFSTDQETWVDCDRRTVVEMSWDAPLCSSEATIDLIRILGQASWHLVFDNSLDEGHANLMCSFDDEPDEKELVRSVMEWVRKVEFVWPDQTAVAAQALVSGARWRTAMEESSPQPS